MSIDFEKRFKGSRQKIQWNLRVPDPGQYTYPYEGFEKSSLEIAGIRINPTHAPE